jgi:glucose/arabinose dehydrogenase
MKKFALMFALVGIAGIAAAQDTKPVAPAQDTKAVAPAQDAKAAKTEAIAKTESSATKTHEVEAEIVSYDAAKKTLTIKGTPDNKTVPVDAKAVASVKDLKAGEKVTLLCRDNDKGEHQGVAGVKHAAKK